MATIEDLVQRKYYRYCGKPKIIVEGEYFDERTGKKEFELVCKNPYCKRNNDVNRMD